MANHTGKAADKVLVHSKKTNHTTLILNLTDGFDLTGYDTVKGDVTDDNSTPGTWKGKRGKGGDRANELRLLLRCTSEPQKLDKLDPPTGGTLTVTVTNTSMTEQTVTVPVVFATDDPP